MTTWITICDTCKRPGWDAGAGGQTDGETLAGMIKAAVENAAPEATPKAALKTRRHSCLMGCARACNVTIQSAGKIGYSLGEFTPDQAAAEAIVAYALAYGESDTGQVPYRQWPAGVKGHFASRHPPLPEDAP